MIAAPVDYETIRRLAPLRSILESDCGPGRGGRFRCALHDDRDEALEHYPESNTWHCFSCGKGGDVFDWLDELRGMKAQEVRDHLGFGDTSGPSRPRIDPTLRTRPERRQYHLDRDWQAAVAEFVADSERSLWAPEGREALSYLRGRGFRDATLREFRIGYNPRRRSLGEFAVLDDKPTGPEIVAVRGIVIPLIARHSWFDSLDPAPAGPQWQGAVIRRQADRPGDPLPLGPDGKEQSRYHGLKGTTRHELYPHPTIDPSEYPTPFVLVEGELDALTGWQEARHLATFATVGGAMSLPSDHALDQLRRGAHILGATDNFDRRGQQALRRWRELCPGLVKRGLLPQEKDLNAYHAAGHDVASWARSEFERHGWMTKPGDAFEGDLSDDLPRYLDQEARP